MKRHASDLPPPALALLREAVAKGGLGPDTFFQRPHQRWLIWAAILTLLGAVAVTVGIWAAGQANDTPLGGVAVMAVADLLLLLYALAAWRDILFRRREGLDAFVLVTPAHILRCWGPHLPLDLYRLAQATSFKHVHEYDQRQNYQGRKFTFTFEDQGHIDVLVPREEDAQRLDYVLDLARAKGRGERVPLPPGSDAFDFHSPGPDPTGMAGHLLNPRSEFWIATGAILCIGCIVAVVVFGK